MKRQTGIISVAFALFLLWGAVGLFAQHTHEFSVSGGGGLSNFSYKASGVEQKSGAGGNFDFGYHYFFTPKWGLGTGAELAFYNANVNIDNFDLAYMAVDMEGASFEFRSTVNAYEEKQSALLLQIPLMLQFQTGGAQKFYIAAGGKVGLPLNGKYNTTASLRNSGYYARENSLYDTQEFMGFGSFPDKKTDGDLEFRTAFLVSVESGVKWRLNDTVSLYAGAYLDYGLNNILAERTVASLPALVEYNTADPTAFAINSVIKSRDNLGGAGATQTFVDKMTPRAAGVRIRLAFGKS